MAEGWVKLHRRIFKSKIWENPNVFRLFVWLVGNVTWQARRQSVGYQWVDLQPGQIATGRKALAAATGLSEKVTRSALKSLEKCQSVAIKRASKFSVITVCNWEEYQSGEDGGGQESGHEGASKGPAKGQQRATNKKEKKGKKVKNPPADPLEWAAEYPALNNDRFVEAWADWLGYRAEKQKKPSALAARRQLKFLSEQPDPVACIENSIRNDWVGIFPAGKPAAPRSSVPVQTADIDYDKAAKPNDPTHDSKP
jgi:hypothetical protein